MMLYQNIDATNEHGRLCHFLDLLIWTQITDFTHLFVIE